MAIIADFMLVYLPAPTVSLRPPIGANAGRLAKFFHNCPDNAFQVSHGPSFRFLVDLNETEVTYVIHVVDRLLLLEHHIHCYRE